MPVFILNAHGKVVRWSRNLRGIIKHNREHITKQIASSERLDHSGLLYVSWQNGDWCFAEFASYTVLQGWIHARRAWKDVPHNAGVSGPVHH